MRADVRCLDSLRVSGDGYCTGEFWDMVQFSTRGKLDNMSLIKSHIKHSTRSSSSVLHNRIGGTRCYLGRASAWVCDWGREGSVSSPSAWMILFPFLLSLYVFIFFCRRAVLFSLALSQRSTPPLLVNVSIWELSHINERVLNGQSQPLHPIICSFRLQNGFFTIVHNYIG